MRFRTECDTEVVANVIRAWGQNGIKHFLAGMYAFVAIDMATGEFLAARDPFGVKPLYLIQSPHGFLFCSEIRPLLEATEGDDVLLLPPGYLLTRTFCGRHYSLPSTTASSAASPHELDRILSEAVRVRVPSGTPRSLHYLAAASTARWSRIMRAAYAPPCQDTLPSGRNATDHIYAKHYADETGLDLREVTVEPRGLATLSIYRDIVDAVETFERGTPSLYTYLLSQRIHQDGFRVRHVRRRRRRIVCWLLAARIRLHAAKRRRAVCAGTMSWHDASGKPAKTRPLLDAIPARNTQAVPGPDGRRLCQRARSLGIGAANRRRPHRQGTVTRPLRLISLGVYPRAFAIDKKCFSTKARTAKLRERAGLTSSKRRSRTRTSTMVNASSPITRSLPKKSYIICGDWPRK